jgi:hypothetical protein
MRHIPWRTGATADIVRLVPENYVDERIARSHEEKWPGLFEPAVVDPTVNFLNDLAE